MYPCKHACIHPISSWSFCLHMPVMSRSPPPKLVEQLRLLQTSSYIEPKSAFLQRLPPPLLALVLPRGATQSKSILAPRDSPSDTKTVMESLPVPWPPPHPSAPSSVHILGLFPSPQQTGCAYYLLRGGVRLPSHIVMQATHPTAATTARPPARPRRCPCPRC